VIFFFLVIIDTSLMSVWNMFLEMIYRNFDVLCRNEEIGAVLIEGCLLRDTFETSFLSWSVQTRSLIVFFFSVLIKTNKTKMDFFSSSLCCCGGTSRLENAGDAKD
jgi:hypothetical protein